ncbi:hypothetical protein ACFVVU_00610 [Kitasatospora sp. NPDC057965]|uniref:hypothetical protein n=1 Tax=Kitasatospora sp. NPDC057965 TaxID=3346291 RepID=UPI0036D8026A
MTPTSRSPVAYTGGGAIVCPPAPGRPAGPQARRPMNSAAVAPGRPARTGS